MINETGTMTGGGGKPKGGRMLVGNAAPRALNPKEATEELQVCEEEFTASRQVAYCTMADLPRNTHTNSS